MTTTLTNQVNFDTINVGTVFYTKQKKKKNTSPNMLNKIVFRLTSTGGKKFMMKKRTPIC